MYKICTSNSYIHTKNELETWNMFFVSTDNVQTIQNL